MDLFKEKIEFPFICPVCGKEEFTNLDWFIEEEKEQGVKVYEINSENCKKRLLDPIEANFVHCSYCGWVYDLKQVLDNDVIGDRNKKTVNELKIEYQNRLKENPSYNFDEEESKPVTHKCPICDEFVFEDENSYDVCPICGWIDDDTESDPLDDYSEVNVVSIKEAKEEFIKKRQINPKYRWKKDKK